ncbi:MAG TPA: FxSxx-COOH system tetratricopeptide repeat protein [Ktedonobacteraceae bacterium]|nr:FxSxx-COOH system tetratricopeptide repeat protein [Ktedonobacteraceae bacterium]
MSQERVTPGILKLCVVSVPEDQRLYARLEQALKQLKRRLPIELWSTQWVLAGSDYEQERMAHIDEADLLVYLLSLDLLDSAYYSHAQLQHLVERHSRGEVQIFSVILRPILLEMLEPPFDKLALLPEDREPVTGKKNREGALVDIALKVVDFVKRIVEPCAAMPDESGPAGQIWTVPYGRNAYFTGRDDLLAALHEHLTAKSAEGLGAIWALTGLGGMGKTQVALEYAYRYRQEYRAVFWLRADSRENLATAGLALANMLRLPERASPEQDLVLAALKRWLQRNEGWLLILDNVADLALPAEFLPVEYHGHVLLTTRMQATGTLARPLAVPALTIEEGARWLLMRARVREADMESYHQAWEVAHELDGLPLALDQAGAYLEETGASMDQYLQTYQRQRADLLNYRGQAPTDHPASVNASFSLALEEIESLYAPAADLLRLCAFLHPATIPEALLVDEGPMRGQEPLPGVASRYELDVALSVLLRYSLVRRDPGAQTLSVHRLVQAVQREALTASEQRAWVERVVTLVSRAWPERGTANWARCQDYLPHALAALAWAEQEQLCSLETVCLLRGVGVYLAERAVYPEAERRLQQALVLSEILPDRDELVTAGILHDLGLLAYHQGRYTQSEEYYQRALVTREATLGPDHLQTAQTLSALGLLSVERREAEQAEPLLQRALLIREQALGPEHPLIAETLSALGRLARLRKRYEQAEVYYRRALAIRENALGAESPEVAENLSNLGVLFFTQGKYSESEPFYQRALVIREQTLGPEHPETAAALSRLALALYFQQQYDAAEPLIRRALVLQEQTLGREHPETIQTIMTLAMLSFRRGEYRQAQTLAEEVLTIRERILHPHAPDLITSLNNLALIYREQQQYEQARALLQRALPLSESEHGQEHINTVRIRDNLAVLAQRAGWPTADDAAAG